MSDPRLQPLERLNPDLTTVPRYKIEQRIADEISSMLDMVLARDGVELDEDSRDEIVCVSAQSIVLGVIDAPLSDDELRDDVCAGRRHLQLVVPPVGRPRAQ